MKQHTSPCKECPFSPNIEPGFLGGSPVETYVGQLNLPFWIPCHCSPNYAAKQSDVNQVTSCAGAAILRANMGVDWRFPDSLLHLDRDEKLAFESLAHFVAHHSRITLAEAHKMLTRDFVRECVQKEWHDANVRVQLKERK